MFELQKELETKLVLADYYTHQLTKTKNDIDEINSKLDICYKNYKKANDRDRQIYYEKKKLGWSDAKISVNHGGIDASTIWRIIKKIEKI